MYRLITAQDDFSWDYGRWREQQKKNHKNIHSLPFHPKWWNSVFFSVCNKCFAEIANRHGIFKQIVCQLRWINHRTNWRMRIYFHLKKVIVVRQNNWLIFFNSTNSRTILCNWLSRRLIICRNSFIILAQSWCKRTAAAEYKITTTKKSTTKNVFVKLTHFDRWLVVLLNAPSIVHQFSFDC